MKDGGGTITGWICPNRRFNLQWLCTASAKAGHVALICSYGGRKPSAQGVTDLGFSAKSVRCLYKVFLTKMVSHTSCQAVSFPLESLQDVTLLPCTRSARSVMPATRNDQPNLDPQGHQGGN